MDGFLTKPIVIEELISTLQKKLDQLRKNKVMLRKRTVIIGRIMRVRQIILLRQLILLNVISVIHLYQKKIIQQWNVRFDSEFKQGEDKLFNYQYFTKINSILYINKPLYHYRQHSLSVSHKFYKEHEENTTRILKKYYEIEPLIQSNKKYKDTYNIRTAYLAWWLIRKYYLHENSTVKKPLKEFENMLKSSPYSESIKKLNVADMNFH